MTSAPHVSVNQRYESELEWPGMRSEYAWVPPHAGSMLTKPNQIGISFSQHQGLVHARAGQEREIDVPAGCTFVTGGEPIIWTKVREVTEALEIYPDLSLLQLTAERAGRSAFEIQPASAAHDSVVFSIASTLRRAHVVGAYVSDVAASTLAHRLAAHLLSIYCHVPMPRLERAGRLSIARIERVASYVDAHLGDRIVLDQLAALVDLSPFHFARAFKRTTGLAPHQFVTLRRLERAKTSLLSTAQTVQSIAYAVGFTNLSHFRRMFRAHTGRLPVEMRAS
jgi:AraC family transcriptional regulator